MTFKAPNRRLVVGSCGVVLLVVLIGAGAWRWAVRGVQGKVVNVEMAEGVTRGYVQALHNGEVGSAYELLAEEVRSRQSPDEFAGSLKTSPNPEATGKYEGLKICEYQFGDEGSVTAIGLLHYEGGDVRFASTLVEASDGDWGIYQFHVEPEIEPKPWAGCSHEGQ